MMIPPDETTRSDVDGGDEQTAPDSERVAHLFLTSTLPNSSPVSFSEMVAQAERNRKFLPEISLELEAAAEQQQRNGREYWEEVDRIRRARLNQSETEN